MGPIQHQVRERLTPFFAGQAFGDPSGDRSYINQRPAVAKVMTVQVDTATNDLGYAVALNGVSCPYTADSSAAKDEISAGLKAAIDNEPLVSGAVTVTDDGVDTITITSRFAGRDFTLTTSNSELTIATTTANDEADSVPMGVAVFGSATDDKLAYLADKSGLVARTYDITPVNVNDALYAVDVTVGGVTYSALFPADSNASVAEITAGLTARLNAQLPANTVLATDNTTKLTLSAEIAGLDFSVAAGSDDATATMTVSDQTAAGYADIHSALVGVTVLDQSHEANASGELEYPGLSVMRVRPNGELIVETEESISRSDDLWLGVSGTDRGKWRKSVGTTAANWLKIDRNKIRPERNISATLCRIRVDL